MHKKYLHTDEKVSTRILHAPASTHGHRHCPSPSLRGKKIAEILSQTVSGHWGKFHNSPLYKFHHSFLCQLPGGKFVGQAIKASPDNPDNFDWLAVKKKTEYHDREQSSDAIQAELEYKIKWKK